MDDAGEAIKDCKFSDTVARADGLILVVPEYNHSFPGLLKHVLDTNLKEYIHKAAGICGVSAGPFGGARMIQSSAAGPARAWSDDHFHGCLFRKAGKLFESGNAEISRTRLTAAARKIPG